jgi:hypothetical protein
LNSARSLESIAIAVQEIRRKLEELENLEASFAQETPIAQDSGVEVLRRVGEEDTEYDNDPDVEEAVEMVRLWCTHVSHVLDRYLHPSLGRFFLDNANRRLAGTSRQNVRATIRWTLRATRQVLKDTAEHGYRLYREGVSGFPDRALLTSGSTLQEVFSGRITEPPRDKVNWIDNWGVIGPPDLHASVFIIHGHDEAARDDLERLLSRRYAVRTVVMYAHTVPTVTLPEKFESCARECNLAIALLTPDDVGGKVGTDSSAARVRQNVLVELGWFWGRCGRHSLLLVSPGKLDLPSDLRGLQVVRYENKVEEAMSAIDGFMRYHRVALRRESAIEEKRNP